MERGHGGTELLGHGAHRPRADRPAEHWQQRHGHLAGREAEQEAGEDHAVDVLGAPRVGADHLERAEGARARHVELDHAELGQQPAGVTAVAPVGLAGLGHARQVAIDRLGHPTFEQLGERLAGGGPIVLAPFHAFRLHGLHHPKPGW